MIDIQIIRYLYSKKNDGRYYDVSFKFNVRNPNNYYNIIEKNNSEIIEKSHSALNNIGILLKRTRDKNEIDRVVVSLEENGYVFKKVEGYLPASAITTNDDPTDANNCICMISPKGIEYYETYRHNKITRKYTIVSLLFSFAAIVISIFALIHK